MTDKEYYELIQPYEDAMKLLLTRLEVLNHSIYKTKTGKPVHNIQYRIKKKDSIEEKLVRHGFEPTLENAKDQLQDIAGVRIICYFVGDVNNLVNMLKKQPDLIFIRERNYIENPKPNGYRSLHLVVRVPVYLSDHTESVPVEIQIRTIAMDFWASLEHQLRYKSDEEATTALKYRLKLCAERSAELDSEMQSIYREMRMLSK